MKTEYPYLDRRFKETARRAGELRKWEESLQLNVQCSKSIEDAIDSHSVGGVLEHGAAEAVLERYGLQRVCFVLANSLKWGFCNISNEVSNWSVSIPVPYDEKVIPQFEIHADARLLDAFVKQVWEARQALGLYGAEHCAGESNGLDYQNKTLVLNADCADRSLASLKDQLWYAVDGPGCRPENWACALRAVRLADGTTETLDRSAFAGVLDERYLPDWTAEKLAELQVSQKEQPEPSSSGMEMTI